MKKIFTLKALCVISFSAISQETKTPQENGTPTYDNAVIGIRAGLNLSRLSTSINSEPTSKPGLNLGLYIKKQIGPTVFFRPELYYSTV